MNYEFSYRNNLTGHTGSINDLMFLNNGDLASCSSDNSIRVWDLNTNKVRSINSDAHNRSCLSLYLLNNKNTLVSSSEDKSIKLWNTNLFYNISIIKGYPSPSYNNNNYNMNDQIDYSLSIVERVNKKLNYCQNSNSLECKKYLNDQNDLLNNF
jgi:WD40 repeat protein